MNADARTPEELETLFEDALMVRDVQAVADLFEEGAVLIANGQESAHGLHDIARLALATSDGCHTYVADPRDISQAHDIALIIAERAINVVRRGRDGAWRYAIVRLSFGDERERGTNDTESDLRTEPEAGSRCQ